MKINIKKITNPKNILLIIGMLIVAISYFLPLTTSCEVTNGPEEFISTTQYGFETFNYYVSTSFICLIIAVSYLGRGSYLFFSIFVLLGGSITLFFNWIGQAGWGRPCGHGPTQFLHLLYFSHLLIIFICFNNITDKRKKNKTTEILTDLNEKP